jgi:hypothetical protein
VALERVRRGIYVKTFTALLQRARQYSPEEEVVKMKEARRYGTALYNNLKGARDRWVVTHTWHETGGWSHIHGMRQVGGHTYMA